MCGETIDLLSNNVEEALESGVCYLTFGRLLYPCCILIAELMVMDSSLVYLGPCLLLCVLFFFPGCCGNSGSEPNTKGKNSFTVRSRSLILQVAKETLGGSVFWCPLPFLFLVCVCIYFILIIAHTSLRKCDL